MTGALGFVFWTIAARGYTPAEVGRASAIISSATLLSSLSNLSLGDLYERFLPVSGRDAARHIASGRFAIMALAAVMGVGFVLLGPRESLFDSMIEQILYPIAVVVLGVFAIQDKTLIGLGRARTVARKNITQSVAKLALVAAFIPLATGSAIVWAWVVPAALIAIWIGFTSVRTSSRAMVGEPNLPPRSEIWHFFAGSLAMNVVGVFVPLVVPLVIVATLGTEMNAYFSICWLIISTAIILLYSTAAPFISAAAEPGADLRHATIRFIALCGGAGILSCVGLIIIAPWVLAIMGPSYAENGTVLVRLMALTLPTVSFVAIYTALAKVERRLRFAVGVQVVFGIFVIAGIAPAAERWGIQGVGYLYLAADLLVVAILLVPGIALIRRALRHPVAPTVADTPNVVRSSSASSGTWS